MVNDSLPSISVIIATFNSQRTIALCLEKVKEQDYPKNKIEIIMADGGSKDKTLNIAKKHHVKVINVAPKKQNAEYNKGVGLSKARNEIVLFLDHDNIMPHKKWLKNIVEPFLRDKKVIGVEPLRFHYDKKMTLLDRYFSLLGGSDPIVYYLGKDSHLSWAFDEYNLLGKAKDVGNYYIINFLPNNIPALGGNGAALRRNILLKYAKVDPDNFIHTDVVADIIKKGFNKYAIIKDSIIHLTNNKVFPFLSRRKYFIEKYQLADADKRRFHIYNSRKDKMKLLKYIIISLTFIIPTRDALNGYLKVRDSAWFLHPFMCFAFLVIYSIPILKGGVRNAILGK